MTRSLLVEWDEHDVLTLTLNRPEQRNALDPELLTALGEALAGDGSRARAVILRGAGGDAFSAGYDLKRLTGTEADLEADGFIGGAVDAMRACPAPVIGLLRGPCFGAAVELAMNCDLRFGAPDLRIAVPAVSLGVVYRYQFVTRLVAICGLNRTADLLLGMRQLDADTAYLWGMLTEVVPADELEARVVVMAQKLATSPRAAVTGTKASLNLRMARSVDLGDLAEAQRLRAIAASSPERREALRRRRPRQ